MLTLAEAMQLLNANSQEQWNDIVAAIRESRGGNLPSDMKEKLFRMNDDASLVLNVFQKSRYDSF